MHALVYSSRALTSFNEDALNDLAVAAAAKNARLDVTGMLYFNAGSQAFFQYLEGPLDPLDDLMARIRVDERHHVEHELRLPPGSDRLFPGWHMRRLIERDLSAIRLEDVALQVMSSLAVRAFDESVAVERIRSICLQLSNLVGVSSD